MKSTEDMKFRENLKKWAQSIETHQFYIFEESAKFVEVLKEKTLSAKTKNEIAIILKGLQATTNSVSLVIKKHIK
jgi:hypothetical protein